MKGRSLVLVLAIVIGSLAIPAAAMANTTEAIADTGGMHLVLLGSTVEVDVTLDEFGNIDSVAVTGGGLTETSAGDHKVRFSTADGATKVDVKAKKDKLSASMRSATLGDLVGDHVWTAEVFPDATATVPFSIAEDGTGNPVLSLGDVAMTGANSGDVEVTVRGPFQEIDDDEAEAKATVEFAWNGFTKTLRIQVEVEDDDDDDDDHGAKLKVELRGKDRQMIGAASLADLVGSYTWTGLLCDGTSVTVDYQVGGDGTVTPGAVGGVGADRYDIKTYEHGFRVSFDNEDARLNVKLKEKDDSTWQLKVDSKTTERCGNGNNEGDDHGNDDHGNDDHDDDDHDDEGDDDHDD